MMKTKLEIIGPYTPDHEGPFCTECGMPVRILCVNRSGVFPIIGLLTVGNEERIVEFTDLGIGIDKGIDLMNAREVRVPREFWINESYNGEYVLFEDKSNAILSSDYQENHKRTIHVREVLEGEEA